MAKVGVLHPVTSQLGFRKGGTSRDRGGKKEGRYRLLFRRVSIGEGVGESSREQQQRLTPASTRQLESFGGRANFHKLRDGLFVAKREKIVARGESRRAEEMAREDSDGTGYTLLACPAPGSLPAISFKFLPRRCSSRPRDRSRSHLPRASFLPSARFSDERVLLRRRNHANAPFALRAAATGEHNLPGCNSAASTGNLSLRCTVDTNIPLYCTFLVSFMLRTIVGGMERNCGSSRRLTHCWRGYFLFCRI